uniref:Uncharacterized protein n=1 Tax=Oryza nivara TaxID=4536 RepID=A0A0E0FLQ3_ORYNI
MVIDENYHLAGSPTLALLDGRQVLSANRICAENRRSTLRKTKKITCSHPTAILIAILPLLFPVMPSSLVLASTVLLAPGLGCAFSGMPLPPPILYPHTLSLFIVGSKLYRLPIVRTRDSTISFGTDKKKKGKRKKTDVCSIALDEDQINVYQFGTLLNVDQLGGIVTCTIIPGDLIIN